MIGYSITHSFLVPANLPPLFTPTRRAMLNMYIPGFITKKLAGAIPSELGQYVVESQETMHVNG